MLYDKKWDKKLHSDVSSRVLNLAAEILENEGWCQGSLHNMHGQHCMLGAMAVAETRLGVTSHDAVKKIISLLPGKPVAAWNDDKGRTMQEVAAMLRKAAMVR